ncbi:MAG TPA: LLM class flavin-dependent oxidoreductase [Bradyrhizobium sp.]|nr:LLM class flavin-dependent oxidoreductase [Bradyrhizobium sp.]
MKEILLNAFCMNAVAHTHQGLWRHPRDRSAEYTDIGFWIRFAQVLEEGMFDGIFMADGLGVYDVYQGSAAPSLRSAVMIPKNDPSLLVSAMAAATRHIGFGITCNVADEAPYAFARKMSTLDHLTKGRMGWNIVTGFLDSAARARGDDRQMAHDERYDAADEYMDIVYRLWEASWEDGAMLRDAASGVYVNADKVHRVRHDGRYFRVDAIHMSEPSPQRTPLLYQAGTSPRGIEFAARHSECVYVSGATPERVGVKVKKLRDAVVAAGRNANDVKVFVSLDTVVGKTDAEARDKHEEYSRYLDPVGALVRLSGFIGIDMSQLDPDEPIRQLPSNGIQTILENLAAGNADKGWTVRDVTNSLRIGGANPVAVGSPATIADIMQRWVDVADVDGFNLPSHVKPESMEDFVRLVVPELQSRKVFKTAYKPGSLREKMFGSPHTLPGHPSARVRRQAGQAAP